MASRLEPFDFNAAFGELDTDIETSTKTLEPFDFDEAFGGLDDDIGITPDLMDEPLIEAPEVPTGYVPIPAPIIPSMESPPKEEAPTAPVPEEPYVSPGILGPINIPERSLDEKRKADSFARLDMEQWQRLFLNLPEVANNAFRTTVAGLGQFFGEIPLNFAFGPDIGTLAPGMAERSTRLADQVRAESSDLEREIIGKAPFVYNSEHFGPIGEYELGFWQRATKHAAESLAIAAPSMALSVASGSPAPMLTAFGVNEFGSSYSYARSRNLKPAAAMHYALRNAGIEVLTELAPAKALLKNDEFFAKLVNLYSKELPQENVATVTQKLNARLSGVEGDSPWPVFLIATLEDMLLTSASVAISSPVQAGGARALQKAAGIPTSIEELYGNELYNIIGRAQFSAEEYDDYTRRNLHPDNAQYRSRTPEDVPIIDVDTGWTVVPQGFFIEGPRPDPNPIGLSPIIPEVRTDVAAPSLIGTRVASGGIKGVVMADFQNTLIVQTDNGVTVRLPKSDDVAVLGDISNDIGANNETVELPAEPAVEGEQPPSVQNLTIGEDLADVPPEFHDIAINGINGVNVYEYDAQAEVEINEVLNAFAADKGLTNKDYEFIKAALETKGRRKYGADFTKNFNDALNVLEPIAQGTLYSGVPGVAYIYAYNVSKGATPNVPEPPQGVEETLTNEVSQEVSDYNNKVKVVRDMLREMRRGRSKWEWTDEQTVDGFFQALANQGVFTTAELNSIADLGAEEILFALQDASMDDAEAIIRSADLAQPTPDGFEMKEIQDPAGTGIEYSRAPEDFGELEEFEAAMEFDHESMIITAMQDIIGNWPEKVIPNEMIQNSIDSFPRRFGSVYQKKGDLRNTIAVKQYNINAYSYESPEDYIEVAVDYLGITANEASELLNSDEPGFTILVFGDTGAGMATKDIKRKLLTIGGKGKDARTSAGGYGQAKQAFFVYPDYTQVKTTHKGVTTRMVGASKDFVSGQLKITPSKAFDKSFHGTQVVMAIRDDSPYTSFITSSFAEYIEQMPTRVFGDVDFLFDNEANESELINFENQYGPDWNVAHMIESVFLNRTRLSNFKTDIDYYQKIVKKKLTGEWRDNKYDIYIINKKDISESGHRSGDNFKVKTTWMSQGLPMNVDPWTYPAGLVVAGGDRPGYEILINFKKLVDTRHPDYPYLHNRTQVRNEIVEHIQSEIGHLLAKERKKEADEVIRKFKRMHELAPTYHGIKVYIPFVEEAFRPEVEELIDEHAEVFESFADIFNRFNVLLESIGEPRKELVITVDPKLFGWKSDMNRHGFEVYAINPFLVTDRIINSNYFNQLASQGIRTPEELMSASFYITMIHEHAHDKVGGHGESFSDEVDRLHTMITGIDRGLFEKEIENVFRELAETINKVGDQLNGYKHLASIINDSESTRADTHTLQRRGPQGVDEETGGGEEGPRGRRVRLVERLFGGVRADVVDVEGMPYPTRVFSKIDVETPWIYMGAPEVGFHIKNFASVKEFYDQETLNIIRKLTRMKGLDYADVALYAENPERMERLRPETRARYAEAVELVRDYFDDTYRELNALGLLANPFPQSKILRLREEIRRAEIRLRDPEIDPEVEANLIANMELYEEQIQALVDLKFVHIPPGLILEELDMVDPKSTGHYRYMRLLNQKRRKTISLQDLIDNEIVPKEGIDVRDIIANYGRRNGNDIAVAKIANAVFAEGLAKKAKRKINDKWIRVSPPEGFVHMGDRYPVFNDYYVRRDVAQYLTKFFEYSYRLTGFDKFLAVIKGLQFERPDIMLWNNTVQSIMLGSAKSLKTPWNFVEGFRQVITMGPLYKEAVYHGLLSKPNNNPFAHYLEMVKHAKQPVLQKFFQLSNFTPWGAVKAYYNAAFYIAWKLDEGMRMMSYLYLRNTKGMTARDAAQLAALAHADYASVPPEIRRALNRFWFTPTFKITMGKLWAESVAASVKSPIWIGKDIKGAVEMFGGVRTAQGMPDGALAERIRQRVRKSQKYRRLVSIALTAGAINLAIDLFMRLNGFDTDEEDMYWGVKYKKTLVTQEGPQELVVTFSHPANLFLKFFWRFYDAVGVTQTGGFAKFLKSIKYEIHPLWRTIAFELSQNRKPNGELIWSPGDDDIVIGLKGASHMVNQFIGLIGSISEKAFATEAEKETTMRMALEFGPILGKFLDLFGTAYMRDPKVLQIKSENNKLIRTMMEEAGDGKLTPEKQRGYQERIDKNLKRIESEMRRMYKGSSIKNPITGLTGVISSFTGEPSRESAVEHIIGLNSDRLGTDRNLSISNLNKMAGYIAKIENDGKRTGTNKKSSAKGMYQMIDETFENSVDYLISTYEDNSITPPEWLQKAAVHGNPNKLSKEEQTAVMLANLFRTTGTDTALRMVMVDGNVEAMKQLYLKYHHTRPNKKLINRVDSIFRG